MRARIFKKVLALRHTLSTSLRPGAQCGDTSNPILRALSPQTRRVSESVCPFVLCSHITIGVVPEYQAVGQLMGTQFC